MTLLGMLTGAGTRCSTLLLTSSRGAVTNLSHLALAVGMESADRAIPYLQEGEADRAKLTNAIGSMDAQSSTPTPPTRF